MSTASVHEQSRRFKLATIFELSLYAMVALSSVMLLISEGTGDGLPPQSFTLLFVIVSFVVVERYRMWFLPWWASGTLGLIALVGAFWNVPQFIEIHNRIPALPEERRLDLIFAGAHLLVYLTWIVLFLEKTNQQFWWLWALCVLQIAVGASQSTESLFGMMLCGYLFLAVWTLSVFSLLQGQQQFDRAQQVAESTQSTDRDEASVDGIPGFLTKVAGNNQPPNRWQGLWRRPSKAIGNVQRDPWAAWINPRFVGSVFGTASLAFVLALLFFFLIPRHPSIWRRAEGPATTTSSVGFSRNLALGDIGQILESTKKVMEVRLTDFQTGEGLDIEKYAVEMGYEEPLFRGMVAVEYEDGRWHTWDPEDRFGAVERLLPGFGSPGGDLVRQQIRLEPVDPDLLFAMPPALYGELENTRESIRLDRLNNILKQPMLDENGQVTSYAILSPKTTQTPGRWPARSRYPVSPGSVFLRVPRQLPALRELAREKSGFNESPTPSPRERAERLVTYLGSSGEFEYTLNANVQDREIDPLEDFLVNRKVGHCEYFASALALMLRSVGIPSRLVSGFKGGEYDETSGLFVVEERHAHAWVEAYIDQHWVILDATPADARADSVASLGVRPTRWKQFLGHLKDFWRRFIVQLNVTEQRRLLAPIQLLFTEAVDWLRHGRGHFSGFVTGLTQQLRSPERWISWQGGLVTFVLLTFLSGVVWLVRTSWRMFQKFRARFLDPLGIGRTVAFYERFRRDCSKAGLDRKPSQTPKEFASVVRGHFSPAFDAADWGHFPLSLVDAYYDVRYGARELSEQTLSDLENQLARFESMLETGAGP